MSRNCGGFLGDLIARVNGSGPAVDSRDLPRLAESGVELQQTFRIGMPVGTARIKVDTFCRQCHGQLIREDEQGYDFKVAAPTSFWQRWFGRPSSLNVQVRFRRLLAQSATPILVTVNVSLVRGGKGKTAKVLQRQGVDLLTRLQGQLCVNAEKRPNDRLLWPHPVQVCPIEEDGNVGAPIECRGKDISLTGMAFYLPHELPTSQVVIHLQESEDTQPLTIAATLVRAHRCADGWYDVGVLFRVAGAVSAAKAVSAS